MLRFLLVMQCVTTIKKKNIIRTSRDNKRGRRVLYFGQVFLSEVFWEGKKKLTILCFGRKSRYNSIFVSFWFNREESKICFEN